MFPIPGLAAAAWSFLHSASRAAPRQRKANALRRLVAEMQRHRRERLTRKMLEVLDDRLLHDIGIECSEIDSIARTCAIERRHTYYHYF